MDRRRTAQEDLEDRLELTLRADGAPLPGGTAQLTIDATPLVNTPSLEIHWFIPQGVQLLGSAIDTFPNVAVNQPVHSERSLSFPTSGTYKIAVSVSLRLAPEEIYGASGVLFFIIDPHGSRVTDRDPDAGNMKSNNFEQITVSPAPVTLTPQAPDDDPCFTIFAHFDRIERPATKGGYAADYRVPLAGYSVEFRESDLVFDDSYGYLSTDANGNVAGSFCDDDGLFDDTLEIYLRVAVERGDPKVYVEDSTWPYSDYVFETGEVESDGGTLNFTENLGPISSGIFNIVEAGYQAVEFWVNSGHEFSDETAYHWEDGYGDDGSYYNETSNAITIADDPSDPDQWDESIMIHEWGHFADDLYSCDDNPGDDHAPGQIIDSELAWGEGYPSYYACAVRDTYGYPDASYIIDINGSGVTGNIYNLEPKNNPINVQNQGSVSAALWDLYDDANDGQDTIEIGHATIQAVYTSDEFNDEAYGFWDDTCNFDTYMRGWVDYGAPADAKTAAVIMDNTGYTLVPNSQVAETQSGTSATSDFTAAEVYRWWNQLTYVGDNSASMNGPEFEAIKTLFTKAVTDLGADPKGTEFTLDLFNNTSPANDTVFAGQFFPETLIDPITGLSTIPGPDPNCNVFALRALSQAINDKEKGDAWLFTDGDTIQNPSVQSVSQLLEDNEIRASVALMVGCMASETEISKEPFSATMLEGLTPEEQQTLMAERLLPGMARAELGLMSDEVPGGIVPYLLTALNSGGQFLYVTPDNMEYAADVLLAQITNSAGAGRWSDYVSDQPTYRWDSLATWEYHWIDAKADGENRGNPPDDSYLNIDLPPQTYFQYFSGPYYDTVHVFEDGYATLGLHLNGSPINTEIPDTADPNSALYALWDNLLPYCVPVGELSGEMCYGYIYTLQEGDWFAIEYYDYVPAADQSIYNNFEILLNLETNEIRYQYKSVPNSGATATVGLENSNGTNGIQVTINDPSKPSDGMGYKFVPAPPQPTQTYTVTVDSSMDAVGFLLTGYSGDFMPLAITDPGGDPGQLR